MVRRRRRCRTGMATVAPGAGVPLTALAVVASSMPASRAQAATSEAPGAGTAASVATARRPGGILVVGIAAVGRAVRRRPTLVVLALGAVGGVRVLGRVLAAAMHVNIRARSATARPCVPWGGVLLLASPPLIPTARGARRWSPVIGRRRRCVFRGLGEASRVTGGLVLARDLVGAHGGAMPSTVASPSLAHVRLDAIGPGSHVGIGRGA